MQNRINIKDIQGKILVSTCLLGLKVRFDGQSKPNEKLIDELKNKDIIFYCPEQGGGLATPREPAEIEPGKTARDVIAGNAKIVTTSGKDVTMQYLKGAYDMLKLCKNFDVKYAVLKSKSPSCGVGKIFDGYFNGNLIQGNGVAAELLESNGVIVISDVDL